MGATLAGAAAAFPPVPAQPCGPKTHTTGVQGCARMQNQVRNVEVMERAEPPKYDALGALFRSVVTASLSPVPIVLQPEKGKFPYLGGSGPQTARRPFYVDRSRYGSVPQNGESPTEVVVFQNCFFVVTVLGHSFKSGRRPLYIHTTDQAMHLRTSSADQCQHCYGVHWGSVSSPLKRETPHEAIGRIFFFP